MPTNNQIAIKSRIFAFEKLDVWVNAKDFSIQIYTITNNFPEKEKYGMVSQLTRAAVSIASNIAEGTSRKSFKDQAHFTHIAYSSLMETTCQLIICRELKYITDETYTILRISIEELSNKLNALYNSQISRS